MKSGSACTGKPPKGPLSVVGSSAAGSEQKAHPLFGDGNIPKNKDMNAFTDKIQDYTPS